VGLFGMMMMATCFRDAVVDSPISCKIVVLWSSVYKSSLLYKFFLSVRVGNARKRPYFCIFYKSEYNVLQGSDSNSK
jgi:hypothetical protein